MTDTTILEILRWIARLAGLLLALFILPFLFATGDWHWSDLDTRQWVGLIGIVALYGGLIVAWVRQGWGGLITVASWLLLFNTLGEGATVSLMIAPFAIGGVHLFCWLWLRDQPAALPRWIKVLIYGPLPVFLLLSTNEILSHPPLMASVGHPVTKIAGSWSMTTSDRHNGDILNLGEMTIHPDASVTGTTADRGNFHGSVLANRSWFGRLMNWRTDYLIRGKWDSGAEFTALVTLRDQALVGDLSVPQGALANTYHIRLARRL